MLRVHGEVCLSLARSWQIAQNYAWGLGASARWPRSYGMDGWMALVDESIALYLHAKQRNTILQAILSYMKYLYENMVRANK